MPVAEHIKQATFTNRRENPYIAREQPIVSCEIAERECRAMPTAERRSALKPPTCSWSSNMCRSSLSQHRKHSRDVWVKSAPPNNLDDTLGSFAENNPDLRTIAGI
jgi:hypothetical protein